MATVPDLSLPEFLDSLHESSSPLDADAAAALGAVAQAPPVAPAPTGMQINTSSAGVSKGVPFTANCPRFQEGAAIAQTRLNMMFDFLDDVNKEMKKFSKAGAALAKACDTLGNFLMESAYQEEPRPKLPGEEQENPLSPTSLFKHRPPGQQQARPLAEDPLAGELTPALVQFGTLMRELAQAQQICMMGLHQTFIEPMETYSHDAMASLTASRKCAASAAEAHSSALRKLLQDKLKARSAGVEDIIDQRTADLAVSQADAETARFAYSKALSTARDTQFLTVTDCLLATVGSLGSFYKQCADMVESYGPHKRQLQTQQGEIRSALEEAEAPWANQEAQLAAAVSLFPWTSDAVRNKRSGAADKMMMLSNSGSGGGASVSPPRERGGAGGAGGGDVIGGALAAAEAKHGAWAQAQRLQTVYTPRRSASCVREGYLFKRSSGKVLQNWQRRWFVLDGTRLCYLRPNATSALRGALSMSDKEEREAAVDNDVEGGVVGGDGSSFARVLVCDVLLSTVRDVSNNTNGNDPPYCFEIHSANRRSYMLQAEGPHELAAWTAAIRKCISDQLCGQDHKDGDNSSPLNSDRGSTRAPSPMLVRATSGMGSGNRSAAAVTVATLNTTCADCGAAGPDWVSLNLGVVVCIGCSGIHRSLGSHISKVRSLALDALTETDLCVALHVGNEKANQLWEDTVQAGWTKPDADAPRETKQNWIQAKYQWRGFLKLPESPPTPEESGAALVAAAESDDVLGALTAIVHGADVNFKTGPKQWTPLHSAAAVGALDVCSTLVLNGADLTAHDVDQCTPLDVAVFNAMLPIVEFLSSKME